MDRVHSGISHSHYLKPAPPLWSPGWSRPQGRGWHRPTAEWRSHLPAGDRTWSILRFWGVEWGHWGHPWPGILLPWHWSNPVRQREQREVKLEGEWENSSIESLNLTWKTSVLYFWQISSRDILWSVYKKIEISNSINCWPISKIMYP